MSNIKQFPHKKRIETRNHNAHPRIHPSPAHTGEIVNIDEKINAAIQERLGKFVKEIQTLKTKQKKLEDYYKALNKISGGKKKNAKKTTDKKTKK